MTNKKYITPMFPYPSNDSLHMGHYYNYGIVDSYCRWQKFKGIEVFQPFGFDSFGLPAENYAIKVGKDPREVTYDNIKKFRVQMDKMNTCYTEELITSDESYYKWTQWIFLKLFEKGLAYKKVAPVNWCTSCNTVLANEQVKEEKCERCKSKVIQKELNQWFFKITDYKDRLIKNLDIIDYPESTIKQQRNWLSELTDWCVSRQRKWGCPIPIDGEEDTLDTFVDSSFYFIRYCDSKNDKELCSKDKYKQVDLYIGGNEHACMHLIYARFINMFLYDIGVVSEEEPFKKVIHQGMIKYKGTKMSKTLGNVISPDDYDPDELRLYLMFIGHYFDGGEWNDQNINGIKRYINRMKLWLSSATEDGQNIDVSKLIETIDGFVESFKFNKVVSTLMEFYNKNKGIVMNKETSICLAEVLRSFIPGFNL